MNYKGNYDGTVNYAVGDVVVFTDNIAYVMKKDAPAGVKPHDQRYWTRVDQPIQEIVLMFHSALSAAASAAADVATLQADVSEIQDVVFDSKTLVLASSSADSDKVYALTVEDGESGGELSIDEIVEEAET